MAKVSVLPIDSFVVINKAILNEQARLSLTLLYQPVIGSNAISLYITLWSFLENDLSNGNTHKDLITNMQMKLEDIIESREKVEAMGLLKTYYQKGEVNDYVYELYNPLSAYEFLNNPILNTALQNNISEKEYKRIINKYNLPKISLTKYNDISCSFKDLFSFVGSEINNRNIKKANHLDIAFEPKISFNDLLSLIPEDFLNYKTITKDTKNLIYQLSFIYNLDNEEMKNIIENSIIDKKIDVVMLQENCRNYYRFEHFGEIPTIVHNSQPLSLRINTVDNTKKAKITRQFETLSPYEFLSLKQGKTKPSSNDLKIIEYLLIEQKLPPGVINVLIDFVLKINDNKLIKAFIEPIASQWKRSDVNTVTSALELARKEYTKKASRNKKIIEKAPIWLNKEVSEEVLTEEDRKKLEKELWG